MTKEGKMDKDIGWFFFDYNKKMQNMYWWYCDANILDIIFIQKVMCECICLKIESKET